MADEDEQELSVSPNQGLFATSSTNVQNDSEDELNDSTSTAGPERSRRRSSYRHREWDVDSDSSASTSASTSAHSPQRVFDHSNALGVTGNYRAMALGNHHSTSPGNRRSYSNSSAVVSPMESLPEWSRSFRVFNHGRAFSQKTFSRSSQFGGKGAVSATVTSSPSSLSPVATGGMHGLEQSRHSAIFGTSSSFYPGYGGDSSICRNASAIFATGCMPSLSASPSPLLRTYRGGRLSTSMGAPSSPNFGAHHATGAMTFVSPERKQLPMLLHCLSSYIALTGKSIITGTADRPLETRKGPLIGSGGFAKVYAGVDCISGQLLSIKEISTAEIDNPEALNAISTEFGLLKLLQHPNIVSYHFFEHSASQKVCRIVMELLTGGSTLFLLDKYGPLNECVLRKFARDLLQAMAFIHEKGISHLDIKPANILVSDKGVVKLCDFGCSKRVNELSKSTNCVFGTPLYMAPEFIKGEANHKSDIWSMGCSLFQLRTGILPWSHTNIRENIGLIFYITSTCDPPFVVSKEMSQDFSSEFMDFMEKCFIRDVNERPDAKELLKHPWITCVHAKLPEHNNSNLGCQNGPCFLSLSSPLNVYDKELECQQELEDLSATISADMCNAWMSAGGGTALLLRQQLHSQSPHADVRGRGDDGTAPHPHSLPQDVHGALGNSRYHSSAVSSRGGGLAPTCATTLLDAPQHDNFSYTIPCGASEGHFVLPSCSSQAISPAGPQYLRINSEGFLDVASAEEDMVKIDADVDDVLAGSFRQQFTRSPSLNYLVGSGSPVNKSASGGVTIQPPAGHTRHHANSHGPSAVFAARSPAGCYNRHVSMAYNPSLSLISNSSFASRGVSPSRRSQTALTASLTGSQQLPSLLPMNGSTSLLAGASMTHSTDDIPAEAQVGAQSLSSVSKIPEGINRDANGRLLMSISVPLKHPDRQFNVEFSVDPEDVQCKMIERRPSYIVALSEDFRAQLAAKVSEVASSDLSSSIDAHGDVEGKYITRRVFGSLHGNRNHT